MPKSPLDSEAPKVTVELFKDLDLPIPTTHAVLSIYEDVIAEEVDIQAAEIESPKGKKITKQVPHNEFSENLDWFSLVSMEGYGDDGAAAFMCESSYIKETSENTYAGMRWVQRLRVGEGVYVVILFKSRIYRYRRKQWSKFS